MAAADTPTHDAVPPKKVPPMKVPLESGELETRVPLEALIEGLSRPGAIDENESARVVQTHISVVFITGTRAIKVKKPIRLWGFLDYGTVEARRAMCEAEVRLNQRLAPDIYKGVVPITQEGGALRVRAAEDVEAADVLEWAVEMVRMPKGATMLERLHAGSLTAAELERAGRRLAEFHASQRLEGDDAKGGLPARSADVFRRNFKVSALGVPDPFPENVHEGLRVRTVRRLALLRRRIRRRVAEGRMVDGHGDIRLEHVIRFGGRTAIVDCCEFTPLLRHIDPLSDAAFLSMDLTVRGRPDLARAFERSYLEYSGDPDAAWLLPLYRGYRAHVRAMVDLQSCLRPEVDEATKSAKALGARRTLALAWTYARTGAVPPVIVMRGPAGVGKSWLATVIAPWLGADLARSDVVRKALLGLDATWRPDQAEKAEVYGDQMHARTYAALIERAREALHAGRAAILDATYLKKFTRDDVRAMAAEEQAPYAVLDVTCDPAIVRQRLVERAARNDDASDADQTIYDEMMASAEPMVGDEAPLVATFESGRPPEEAILPLLAVLEAQLDARNEPLGPERRREPKEAS